MYKIFTLIFLLSISISCSEKDNTQEKQQDESTEGTLFTKLPSDSTQIKFTNYVTNERDFNIFKYRNFYNGGGVAIGDINNDGLCDVYLTANRSENKLYLNQGNFKFKDIAESSEIGRAHV